MPCYNYGLSTRWLQALHTLPVVAMLARCCSILRLNNMSGLQSIKGLPKLTEGLNPATWMLQISTPGIAQAAVNKHLDFACCIWLCELPDPFCLCLSRPVGGLGQLSPSRQTRCALCILHLHVPAELPFHQLLRSVLRPGLLQAWSAASGPILQTSLVGARCTSTMSS